MSDKIFQSNKYLPEFISEDNTNPILLDLELIKEEKIQNG